jgi:predicted ribosome-associated RNA-binding protein Tma20
VRGRAFKLRAGGLAPIALTITAPNDLAQQVPGKSTWWSFDLRTALDTGAPGTFAGHFPRWDETGCLIEIYDDADPTNWDAAKVVFGGGEDQIDDITGASKRNLTEIYDLIAGSNIWSCLVGVNYTDTGAVATDQITFTPWLLKGEQSIEDRFLRSSTVEVYAIDGANLLFTLTDTDTYLSTTLTAAVNDSDTVLPVVSSAGVAAGDFLAIEDEIVVVTNVPTGTSIAVTRAQLGTTAVAHNSGALITRSGADERGVFRMVKTGTSLLVPGNTYTVKVVIGYKAQTYTSSHQIIFLLNDV